MNKVWSLFWKFFLCAFGAAFVVSIILGIANGSASVTYTMLEKIFVVGIGICGIIGIFVVPIELYFSDKAACGKNKYLYGGGDSASILEDKNDTC